MYVMRYQAEVSWVGDGSGPVSVPSAQKIMLGQIALGGLTIAPAPNQPVGQQTVPGGDSPTQANFNTACAAMATDIEAAIAANLGQIQGFATGSG